jgi:RNA polymerase sigma-70 factor (ECF subfamily)
MDDHAPMDVAELVAKYHGGVFGYAYRLTNSVQDAEDLTQQVFLKAHQHVGKLRNADSVQSWLFAILRNCFRKSCSKSRPQAVGNLKINLDNLPEELPEELGIDRERLQRVLAQMPEKFRLVLTMFYYEDRSYREIAEALQLPIGTVMSRLARAKASLRSGLFDVPAEAGEPAAIRRP